MRKIEDLIGTALLAAAAVLMPLAALQMDGGQSAKGGACGGKLETACARGVA